MGGTVFWIRHRVINYFYKKIENTVTHYMEKFSHTMKIIR